MKLAEILKEAETFFPVRKDTLRIYLTQLCATNAIERFLIHRKVH